MNIVDPHCGPPVVLRAETAPFFKRVTRSLALVCCLAVFLGANPAGTGAGGGSGGMNTGGGGGGRSYPTALYFAHFSTIYDGDYADALANFKSDLSGAIKTTQSRWIDSIAYYTMVGECHYHLGKYGDALDNYNAALKLCIAFPDWMLQVQFPSAITGSAITRNIPWGRSERISKIGRIPSTMLTAQGQLYIDKQLQQGGVITPPQLVQINVQEIVRCTALAMKRRQELLGPIAQHDPLSAELAVLFARRPGDHRNPWTEAWVDAEVGMAYASSGQSGQAVGYLKRSLAMSGEYDHGLTPMLLLELGQLATEAGEYKAALKYFEEASYSAVEFGDFTTLEESFRYGQQAYYLADPSAKTQFPPLAAASAWARTRGQELRASLQLLIAESDLLAGKSAAAASALGDAKSSLGTRTMGKCEFGSRLNYLAAILHYQAGKVADGDKSIADSLTWQKTGSKWLFQIGLADGFVSGKYGAPLGSHRALTLYETLLRDPTPLDWAARPLDSLAVLTWPHPLIYEHWFENTLQSGLELSMEVADRTRRHRFLSSLPLGGRLLALRWVLESPIETLDRTQQLQRTDLLTRYPKYKELSQQVRKLRDELAGVPLAADNAVAQKKQNDILTEIGKLSAQQEVLIREIGLRREAADLVFPPLRATKEIQATLQPRQLMLIFFSTASNTYACLLSKDRYASWKIESPQTVEKRAAILLRTMGNFDSNREIQQTQLDDAWRTAARDVSDALLAGSKVNLSENIDELIIVPDGFLWYLPFEVLPVAKGNVKLKNGKDTIPLIMKSRIRYLPTMGLATPDRLNRKTTPEVGVAIGKLHLHDQPDAAQTEFTRLQKVTTHITPIKGSTGVPTPLYGGLFDTLLVLDDIVASKKSAFEWSPLQFDKLESQGSLSQWMTLPWKSPLQILLPGFHTPAESALKSIGSAANGQEMFLSICGLMSTGTRTVVISRWRTGGQSSYELLHQFAQELPFSSAADAWQRSVQMLMETPLDVTQESRVKAAANAGQLTGAHPFFWSGYVLVDTGWTPPTISKPVAPPAQKAQPNNAQAQAANK